VACLEELLLGRRDGDLPNRARSAATAYVAAVGGHEDDLTTSAYLARAWTLSRIFKLADVEDLVLDELERRIAGPAARKYIGVIMPMLAITACPPTNTGRETALHATTEKVLAELASTTTMSHIVDEIGDLRRKIVTSGPDAVTKKTQIRANQIGALRRAAEAPGLHPLVKQAHLMTAAEFATRHSLREDLKQIQRDLEEVSAGDLGLQRFSAETAIDPWYPEQEMHPFVQGHTWHHGLQYFLFTPPPTGDVDELRKSVTNRNDVLAHLFPTVLLGHRNLPRATLSADAEKLAHDMSQQARAVTEHVGQVHALGLYRLADKYGVPSEDELTTFLVERYRCDPDSARVLAKAFGHFWNDNHLEAVYLAAPAVEDAARRLLRELDGGAYQVQVGKAPGKYPGLGVLLDELDNLGLAPSWHYYLTWLLLGPVGANIRNDVGHGFTKQMNPIYAALVLRAAAALLTAAGSVDGDQKAITILGPPPPRSGALGIYDRIVSRTSRALLHGHSSSRPHAPVATDTQVPTSRDHFPSETPAHAAIRSYCNAGRPDHPRRVRVIGPVACWGIGLSRDVRCLAW